VKPGNVLIDSRRCYLTDFGLTRRISSQTALTANGQFVGTVDYMPPEQIEGGPLDARSDVYALGCVLYHALTGAVPYEKDSEVSVIYAHLQGRPPSVVRKRPELPSELDAVVATALAKAKEDRYPTCGALIAAAREALGELTGSAAPLTLVPRPSARTVLVVARDRSVRATIEVALGAGDAFRVTAADDADSALELARERAPDVVFLDWSLVGERGAELCAALRADPDTGGTRIVALTRRLDRIDERHLRAAGADAVVTKPFSTLRVLHTIRALLRADA
jgi:CheY-like chemotaxis protein